MKKLTRTVVLIVLTTWPFIAQPQGLPPPKLPDNPDKAPIDGGLIGLVVGGAAYAISKLRAHSNADSGT